MWKNSLVCRVFRVVLPTALLAAALSLGAGCQRFDAAEPIREQIDDQFTHFGADLDALLQWCVDEAKGNPDSWGP